MRNFIHTAGASVPEVAEHEAATKVSEIAAKYGVNGEALVFMDDSEEPADSALTLGEAGVGDNGHIHVARCRRVTTTVNFKEDSKEHAFPPNVAIAAVYEWAVGPKSFDLSPSDRAEHMLVIADTETAADEDAHLEAYANEDCEAKFDLTPKHRFEG
jgi:hypothetical protein